MRILSEEFLSKYKNKNPKWGFNGLGYIVYKRTYSRKKANGLNEEWWETVARCIEGAQEIGAQYTKSEAEELFDKVFNLKCSFGGRMLWQLGTDTVRKFGSASLVNCWFLSMREREDFCFLFEKLMLGGGVGFSVKREDIHELPRIKKDVVITHEKRNDADFIVPDSRQGWVELLRRVLTAYYETGKSFSYSTILVRGAGEPIKGFGGTASGPDILVQGIQQISNCFRNREGKKLRSIDVLDICNIIGSIVVAGNVRRSAQVALGDPDDYLYLRAKRWDLGNIPNWRAMSNNSIYADDFDHLSASLWDGYNGNGEPYGLMNLPLARSKGRLNEDIKDACEGGNPCMEINLEDGEGCNLCELFINNIDSEEELTRCALLLYKTQKAVWSLPSLYEKTERVVKKNFRLGLGVTGVCQSLDKLNWLDGTYRALRKFDEEWSKLRGWPKSIKMTTIKPSGTLSLLAGSTPGVHPAYAQYYIRRIRMASDDALVKFCKDSGFHVEYVRGFDGTEDRKTVVVEFPCFVGENVIVAEKLSAVAQLELVKKLQTLWADNSVSVTVYYKKEELIEIRNWLMTNYKNSLKTVSFLLHSEHGFHQAPYEEITEETYLKTAISLNFDNVSVDEGSMIESLECSSGVCPIR